MEYASEQVNVLLAGNNDDQNEIPNCEQPTRAMSGVSGARSAKNSAPALFD